MLASAATMAMRAVPPNLLSGNTMPPLVTAPMGEMEMTPAPINPAWVLSGDPQARAAEHSRSPDDAALTAVWDCTDGSFRWYFPWDETVLILEGTVHVTAADGSTRTLKTGDIAYFAGDTWATWQVEGYVRKIAFLRRPFPKPLAAAIRIKRFLTSGGSVGLAA